MRSTLHLSRPLRAAALAACLLTPLALAASCSLGLDESLIEDRGDGGVDGLDGDPALDGSTDARGLTDSGVTTCTRDEECATTHGCLKGRCDLTRLVCVYDVCRPTACNAAACDTAKAACEAPKPYPYRAAQFATRSPVVTNGRGFAAVYPFLFVLTSTGAVAFNISTPSSTTPPEVPIVGLGFVPTQMVTSGNRVYFTAAHTGPAEMATRLPVAYADVPTDPFAERIVAHGALATYNQPQTSAATLFPRGGQTALHVGPVAGSFPAALLEAPLVEPLVVTGLPITFSAGSIPVAVSGNRLVMYSLNPATSIASFGIIAGAGNPSTQNAGDTAFADYSLVTPSQAWDSSDDGAVYWSVGSRTKLPSAEPPEPATRAVKGGFILPDATGMFQQANIDVEVYANVAVADGAAVAGPVALLDADTALVTTADAANPTATTAVQFVKREPLAVLKNADGTTPRRLTIPAPITSIVGAAASNGLGFVLENRATPTPHGEIHVFDPACPP